MDSIKNILICGLGAIGGYYASVIAKHSEFNLKILVDKDRFDKYKSEPRIINNEVVDFDYILPDNTSYKADLIIIATKSSGLSSSIGNINNFISENTIILSFMNGITSENLIGEKYGRDRVLNSYLIGHTFFRTNNNISHDGNAQIVFGSVNNNIDQINKVKEFFEKLKIQYKISPDILKSQWEKFCFNCCVNQISAVTRMTFGEMKKSKKCLLLIKNISDEISQIASKEGIESNFYTCTIDYLNKMLPLGKSSMLQDIENGIKPEIDIFGKTVIDLAKKHKLDVPYNKIITEIIELL